jgi:hypothetical protein
MSCSQRYHDATSMASLPSAHCIFQLCGVAFIALGVSAENVKSRHLLKMLIQPSINGLFARKLSAITGRQSRSSQAITPPPRHTFPW